MQKKKKNGYNYKFKQCISLGRLQTLVNIHYSYRKIEFLGCILYKMLCMSTLHLKYTCIILLIFINIIFQMELSYLTLCVTY